MPAHAYSFGPRLTRSSIHEHRRVYQEPWISYTRCQPEINITQGFGPAGGLSKSGKGTPGRIALHGSAMVWLIHRAARTFGSHGWKRIEGSWHASSQTGAGDGRRRFPGLLFSASGCCRRAAMSSAATTFTPAASATSLTSSGATLISRSSGTTSPSRSTWRWTRSTTSRAPPRPIHYQNDPVQTTKVNVHGAINMLGLAKRRARPHPPGLDLRGLRRPRGAPPDRGLLGQRQLHRPALVLRRGQALRRDAFFRLPPPAPPETSAWRASSTPTARACTPTTGAWSAISSCRR